MNTVRANTDVLLAAVAAAIRAPSPHNTQPWIFEHGGECVAVHLDRERVLDVADPDAREARLSCGAALFNMRVTLSAAGYQPEIELLPDRSRPDFLATVRIGRKRQAPPNDRAMAKAVHGRHSHRRPFSDRPVPAWARTHLVHAANAQGAELELLERPGDLEAVAALVRTAERRQSEDPAFRAELRDWTTGREGRADGVPAVAGGPRPEADAFLPLRQYDIKQSRVERPYERTPLVGALVSYSDTPLAHLRCGEALQRILLTAVEQGLSASFLSQPVEVPEIRVELREFLGGRRAPQALLRFGYGFTAPVTPRRGVDEVTRRTGDG